MTDIPPPDAWLGEGPPPPREVWTDGGGTRVEVIDLHTEQGRIVEYKVFRAGQWLGDFQFLDDLARVVDLASLGVL
ncbi:MAG TPA: hypothetical protein VGL39_27005 [Jatrophihabitantaceae bacterium]|jgi:hypothetical protein